MTHKARRRLFYSLLALFIVLGTGVVLYAQGWRFDFATHRFNKVGAIFVRSFPADASISLSGKPIESQVGFLSRGTLITDLFPRIYQLKLTAPGYDTWQENAPVSPSLVTEFKYAVLVPQNATSAASGTVANFIVVQKALSAANASNTVLTMAANDISVKKSMVMLGTSTLPTLPAGMNQKISLVQNGLLGILQTDGSLYLYNTGAHSLQKLADDTRDFSPTSDGTMVAALEHQSIEIFSLNNPSNYYRFNVPNIGDVQQLIWYHDENHLFVVYKNSVAFLDFADSSLSNFTTVAQGTSPIYDPQANALYITVAVPNRKVMQFNFPQ